MTNYEKLKKITSQIDDLVSQRVTSTNPDFKAWHSKTERLLINIFGTDSFELTEFRNRIFYSMVSFGGPNDSQDVQKCIDELKATKVVFEDYLSDLLCEENNNIPEIKKEDYTNVFIVHGHDGELKNEVALLLEKQHITGIVLSEQINRGMTIIEKFENYSGKCAAAIVLMTDDDKGKAKTDTELKSRARQNVIFEAGYFMGVLGRKNVIIISDSDIEIPSDLQGVVYTNSSNWKFSVLRELKSIGYDIDANLLLNDL